MWTCLAQVVEQSPSLFGGGGHPSIYARRRTPIIDLRHLTNGEDQVGITPQKQLLQVMYLSPAPLLRRAEDPLLEPLHRVVGGGPVDAGPSAFVLVLDRGRVRQASTCLSRVVASDPFASFPRQLARSLHPFRSGISIKHGPIRSLLPKPTFAFSRILYPLANWPFLTVGLEEFVNRRVPQSPWGLPSSA